MLPTVAICIPTYNQAQYLKFSVPSACRQTYQNLEVWVSDDASTDDTPKVMAELCEQFPQVRYYRQPHNLGTRDNPDWLMRQTTADFIVKFDSDDVLEPSYVETLVNLMIQYPQAGYAHGAVTEIGKDGEFRQVRRLARTQEFFSAEEALRAAVSGYRVAANICLYRSQALKAVDFFKRAPSNLMAEDYNTSIQLADAGYGNVYSSQILSSYRVWGGGQWTLEKQIAELEAIIQILEKTLQPAFEKRNWSLKPIEAQRYLRARQTVPLLANRSLTQDQYISVKALLTEMGNSPALQIQMFLIKLPFYAHLRHKSQLLTWRAKAYLKNLLYRSQSVS